MLKPTGSIYLHCDSTASHYLKVLLDAVFGPERFLNEITWKRTTAHNDPQRYGRVQDRILFYSKSASKVFHPQGREYSPEQLARYKYEDGGGRFKAEQLTAPHFSQTRTFEWRGTHPGANRQWRFKVEELERLYAEGRILLRRDGCPRKDGFKEYIHEVEAPVVQDLWTDIGMGPTSGERLGYPTQKPVALLERIIAASSNEGDTVLDPFCGCGTTIHAAQRLDRNWIGIDVTHLAISLIENRLEAAFPGIRYDLHGTPRDFAGAEALADHDKHQFEWWALSLVKAQPANDKKKGADKGVDGLLWLRVGQRERAKVIVSVKGGANISVTMIRDLGHVIQREQAAIGLFLTLHEPTGPMKAEAIKAGFYEWEGQRFPRIQILTVGALLNGTRPELPLIDYAAMARQAPVDRRQTEQARLL